MSGSDATERLVKSFGVLTPNVSGAGQVPGIATSNNSINLWTKGQPSGFQQVFQNSSDDGPNGNGDQSHHFAAYFQLGYVYGAGAASTPWLGEAIQAVLRLQPINQGDVELGKIGVAIGADLKSGKLTPDKLGDRIRDALCKK